MESKLLFNCLIAGVITIVIGLVTERTLSKYERKDNFLSRLKKNYALFIVMLFLFGCFTHYFFEYIGLEAACEKKCENNKCEYRCYVKVNQA